MKKLNNQKNELSEPVLFKGQKIRRIIFNEEWWFSVVDVCAVLSGSPTPRQYWEKIKIRDFDDFQLSPNWGQLNDKEKFQLSIVCRQLKLKAPDGKMRKTDCANIEGIFRIIQSIPSPKAEPFKRWLAKVGYERVQEIADPELAMDRAKVIYEKKGYPKDWIDKRMRGIAVRHGLTDEWRERGLKRSSEYAILTNEIMESTFGLKVDNYKKMKGLERENLRDHMEDMELILTMLGEATTTKLTQGRDSQGFVPLKKDANDGGGVAGRAKKDIEKLTGTKVVNPNNFLELNNLEIK